MWSSLGDGCGVLRRYCGTLYRNGGVKEGQRLT